MTDQAAEIALWLERWFEQGDKEAHRRAYTALQDRLVPTPYALRVLGGPAADEIRQDVITRLIDRTQGALRGVQYPVAFAKKSWLRALASELRKWRPRAEKEADVHQYELQRMDRDESTEVERRLDAEKALRIADELKLRPRLLVLISVRPQRISDADWSEFVKSLPPPPPQKPARPLEPEDASLLFFPPRGTEDAKQRYQRLNSFKKAWDGACEKIREMMEADP